MHTHCFTHRCSRISQGTISYSISKSKELITSYLLYNFLSNMEATSVTSVILQFYVWNMHVLYALIPSHILFPFSRTIIRNCYSCCRFRRNIVKNWYNFLPPETQCQKYDLTLTSYPDCHTVMMLWGEPTHQLFTECKIFTLYLFSS